jgi:hypothetical protein
VTVSDAEVPVSDSDAEADIHTWPSDVSDNVTSGWMMTELTTAVSAATSSSAVTGSSKALHRIHRMNCMMHVAAINNRPLTVFSPANSIASAGALESEAGPADVLVRGLTDGGSPPAPIVRLAALNSASDFCASCNKRARNNVLVPLNAVTAD